ncbi:MAG TPA: DUF3631 domain-containing protein, partial [Polyangiaceae bacterium]|nr:DUF3631 domain-containing protein [Polyangiaceae bacterium]
RLAELSRLVLGADGPTLALVREEAIRRVEATGVAKAAAKLVDAHLPRASTGGEARGGQGRSLPFEEANPWPERVSTADLLAELVKTFALYVVLPPGAATALALWILHTHAFDAAQITPRLAAVSPEKRCGKSTLLKLLDALVRRPLSTANASPSAVFRVIEAQAPTLLIDEADTFLGQNDELRGVLNAGHDRSGMVIRVVGDDLEVRAFRVWAPVAIAGIGKLPDTLMDRSIVIPMNRKKSSERVSRFRRAERDAIRPLRRKCERWALDETGALRDSRPIAPDDLNDRAADNWEALFAIADVAGEPWSDKARRAALVLSGERDDEDGATLGETLLGDVRSTFDARTADRLSTKTLIADLARLEGRPWAEVSKGQPLTSNHLGKLLRRFGIKSKTIRLDEGTTAKGYHRQDFVDAWARYLPAGPVTAVTSAEPLANRTAPRASHAPPVTAIGPAKSASNSAHVTPVTAPTGATPASEAKPTLTLVPARAPVTRKDTQS